MGIGRHCAVETCMQLDFLPFSCDCCSRTFCLDHRSYAAHDCPDAKNKETEVIVCPVCAKGARARRPGVGRGGPGGAARPPRPPAVVHQRDARRGGPRPSSPLPPSHPLRPPGIRLGAKDDPNVVFERHSRTECDPANYARVHHKPRCSAPGCKEKLTTINAFTCKSCGLRVCLKHRDVDDHKCAAKGECAARRRGG